MVPQNGCFIIEIPIKMDDLGVPPFKETTKCLLKTSEISLRPPALGVEPQTTMVKWSFLDIEKNGVCVSQVSGKDIQMKLQETNSPNFRFFFCPKSDLKMRGVYAVMDI